MKKVLAFIMVGALLCSTAFAATIHMQHDLDLNDLTDCTIKVGFTIDDVTDSDIRVTAYEDANYDLVDIEQLQVGDTLETADGDIIVESIETDDFGSKHINGGQDIDGGVTLFTMDNVNGYMQSDFEYIAIAERGDVTIPFADQVTINVYKMNDDLSIAGEGYDAVTTAAGGVRSEILEIAERLGDDFYPYQTTLRIESGAVVEITVDYMP